jgi:hypothetical protein
MEILRLLYSRRCPLANSTQPNCQFNYKAIYSQSPLQNSAELIVLTVVVITSRHGPNGKLRSSIVACICVARERVYRAVAYKRVA